jgi:pantoate--beta-alanine ligase
VGKGTKNRWKFNFSTKEALSTAIKMILFKQIEALQASLSKAREQGKSIGFVPTMGALHQGHLSLLQLSREQNDLTVCSIFVNPTQFNDPKDFEKYPVTIGPDTFLLEQTGVDILFLPAVAEMYPQGTQSQHHYDLGALENLLDGAYRPGHFQGVCQVVHRLLSIVQPRIFYLGRKDYQQCLVLKRMVEQEKIPAQIAIGPTLREKDGLAMSSRNVRLSPEAREKATAIFKALSYVKENIKNKAIPDLQLEATAFLLRNGFDKVDYIQIADAETLLPVTEVIPGKKLIVLAAAFIEGVRLIDNIEI